MTRFFEVTNRDGPARLGRLRLDDAIETPAIITKDEIAFAGPIWGFSSIEDALKAGESLSGKTDKIVIGPHVAVPFHIEPPFSVPATPTDGPSGFVVHPLLRKVPPASDVRVVGAAGSLHNPRELVAAILKIRRMKPPDSALYTPALATPANLALLIYLGVDLVDGTRVVVDGLLGRYHLRDGVWPIEELKKLPCRCSFCRAMEGGGRDPKMIAEHNLLKLEEELLIVQEMIRAGTIREYVERQVRVTPEQTTALRLLDQEHEYLEQRTPVSRRSTMYANCAESLTRVEVTRFARRVLERYRAPDGDVLLLLPCSARKPYSTSRSHRLFAMALGETRRRLHELVITSPLALVPRELEEVYPAASYDVPVTGRWDREERAWILSCLDAYLERNTRQRVVAHLEGELREMLEEHGIDAVYTGGGTDGDSLARLKEAAVEATRDARRLEGYPIQRFRALADYHFGRDASSALLTGDVRVRGRELQSADREALAALTPNGTIALSIEGAKRLLSLGGYIVEIGDFLPRGDVLAPGVTDADDQIRPGDEVIVMGEAAFGVGKARMSGWEMVESTRGIAVELRHVEKT
ncbi:MAG: archaeosine synthase subunit alpha [Methanothrix sp.]|uniref:Archaeosine tRNA-ribosyltransferase n=1 Tax=Methanothrix harundinacea TaxID=301375 RepID=A0A101FSU1_9EURY|nr:MAG: pseudouridine synthase [Methanosaeta sp. SDB]KUK43815.1 MAG: Archaeosine tRNA-ribosyltransferase [Methanothrix harundinacea]KUK96128.1 MAG: Archaeosine tRNA-ribosyltransferase [Methanothrix harundinacea]MDD5767336.1 archaeosine synthase subunit alpha [Methanothrix sp.]MDI9399945.1 archaeosine synthase subunit alpha [Euryarchaeota archaeon]